VINIQNLNMNSEAKRCCCFESTDGRDRCAKHRDEIDESNRNLLVGEGYMKALNNEIISNSDCSSFLPSSQSGASGSMMSH